MDVNLIGSEQISSDPVSKVLAVPPHLLYVLQKVKLNAQQNLILSIHNIVVLIVIPSIASARNPMEKLSMQTNIRNHPDGKLAELEEEKHLQKQMNPQLLLVLTQMDVPVSGSRQISMDPVKYMLEVSQIVPNVSKR